MRVFGAENGHALGHFHLGAQGLQIVGGAHEVGFGVHVVPFMSAQEVGVGEGAELPACHKGLQFGLHGGEFFSGRLAGRNGVRQLGGLGRIGLKGAGHVYKVQGVEMVEVHQMVVHELVGQHHVAYIGRVGRNGLVDGVFKAACGCQSVSIGADAAGALGKMLGIARVAAFKDGFNAAEEGGAAAGLFDHAAFDFHFNTQMAFDAGQRIHHNGTGVIALGRFSDLAHFLSP